MHKKTKTKQTRTVTSHQHKKSAALLKLKQRVSCSVENYGVGCVMRGLDVFPTWFTVPPYVFFPPHDLFDQTCRLYTE